MEVHFTPEEEEQLSEIAAHLGSQPEQMVKDAALRLLGEDVSFRAAIRKGISEANQGELIDEEDMDARLKRMLQH